MLSADERNTLREIERQFTVRPVLFFRARRMGPKRSRRTDRLGLMPLMIYHVTLLAAGSLGAALQPAAVTGAESAAMTRLHRLFAEARSP